MAEQGPFYVYAAFIFTYGTTILHSSRDFLLTALLVATGLSVVTIPLAGFISDRIGRKRMYLIGAVTTGIFCFVYFAMLHTMIPVVIALGMVPGAIALAVIKGQIGEDEIVKREAATKHNIKFIDPGHGWDSVLASFNAAEKEIVAEEELRAELPGLGVVGVVEDERPHQRQAGTVGVVGECVERRYQPVAELEILPADRLDLGAVGPGQVLAPAPAVQAEDRAEGAELEPAGEELLGRRSEVAADVGGPVRHAGYREPESRRNLPGVYRTAAHGNHLQTVPQLECDLIPVFGQYGKRAGPDVAQTHDANIDFLHIFP
jgi:hypothetical protein